ncbi:MAG: hypothetical protein Q7K55_07840 [Candidatus Levybacteria bacterium]|nr:hypothetical protein [Candidatus Levybacteria bacterium]
MENKTVLQEIGVSKAIVQDWLNKGLIITYPIKINSHYFQSEDGKAFIENADKYVPLLSKKEKTLYKKNPKAFRDDFLKNARFYVQFINWISKITSKTQSLPKNKRFISLLSLLYLFQRGMDYHYFHFDRYLAYQNYPNTPVGYWWKKLRKISFSVSPKIKIDKNIVFLNLLSLDKKILETCKDVLIKEEYANLEEILKNIKIFEDVQDKEIKTITDFETKENTFFRTVIPIWENIKNMLIEYPELVKDKNHTKLKKILEEYPIVAIRHILIPSGLQNFREDIFLEFIAEITRWLKSS